jgi:hypothetical protein
MTTITETEWRAKGAELFGDDMEAWRFVCPACGDELSLAEAKEKHPELAGCGWAPGQECIGRYTDKVDCDWCAYGLLSGPLFIDRGEKTTAAFDFAGRPFTGAARASA